MRFRKDHTMSDFLAKLRAKAAEQAAALEQAGSVPLAEPKPQSGPETVLPPAPLPTVASTPSQPIRALTGLRLPGVQPLRPATPTPAVTLPPVSSDTPPPPIVPDTPPKPAGLQLGAGLARLVANTGGQAQNVTIAARPALTAPADYAPCYSAAEFIEDWNALELAGDPEPDEQAEIFKRAGHRIAELFDNELAGLAITAASDKSITEIAALVNLTFIRVKDAPSAWATLDRVDKAAVIKGMRAIAAKRNSAVKGKKKADADALSSSFTEAAALTAGFDDDDLGDLGSFDLGF
jgi:hypothetical protein